jgi:hypothetical protein
LRGGINVAVTVGESGLGEEGIAEDTVGVFCPNTIDVGTKVTVGDPTTEI